MTSADIINYMNTKSKHIEYIMEDFEAGLMSNDEARQLIRDIQHEMEGFQAAARIDGFDV